MLTLSSSYVKGGLLEQHHQEIMRWTFTFVVLLCALLIRDVLKILRLQNEQIEGLMGIELALTSLIDLKDHYTEGHSKSVRDLARHFAEYIELSPKDVKEIVTAAELHDIGKIGVPDLILNKPGKLNDREFFEIKKHPLKGADSIRTIKGFENVAKIIKHHHEKYDGTGYPDGLAGRKIPLGSRIIGILDAFHAMVYGRSYRKAMTKSETLAIMEKGKGAQFDPEILDSFKKFMEMGNQASQYDPVCGMSLNRIEASFKSTYKNQTYSFCSETCLQEFGNYPEKYTKNIMVSP